VRHCAFEMQIYILHKFLALGILGSKRVGRTHSLFSVVRSRGSEREVLSALVLLLT